jgi:WD40 repeat protein
MHSDGSFLIGTEGGSVLEKKSYEVKFKPLISSASDDLLCLCLSPTSSHLITFSCDLILRKYETSKHQLTHSRKFSEKVTAMDWSKEGNVIVCADRKGKIYLLENEKLMELDEFQADFGTGLNSWVQEIKISPDGNMIVLGGFGNFFIQTLGLKKFKIYEFSVI